MLTHDIITHCPHCHFSFMTTIGVPPTQIPMFIAERYASCPNPQCRKPVLFEGGTAYNLNGRPRFLPRSGTATKTKYLVYRNCVDEIYFSVGRKRVQSLTWKMWRYKDDIYLACRETSAWKASFHKSGTDNIGYTADAVNSGTITLANGSIRHFFSARRPAPHLAHFIRILRIKITSKFTEDFSDKIKHLSSKSFSKLILIDPDTYKENIIFDVIYTDGHPEQYEETRWVSNLALGIIKIGSNEYFSIIPNYSNEILDNFAHFNTVPREEILHGIDSEIKFGESAKRVFLISVSHK